MAVVTLTINGRDHEIACDDQQVERVIALGRQVDTRAQALLKQLGPVPDTRLLVMVGLMLADELAEAKDEVARVNDEMTRLCDDVAQAVDSDALMAHGIDQLAARIEAIAERLERA